MKRLFLALLPLFANSLQATPAYTPIISEIDKLYIPHGFDNNDIIEVVISGEFPSSCYQLAEALTEIDQQNKIVTITPQSYKEDSERCIQMISPYSQVIKLGKMGEGNYTFKVTNNAHLEKTVNIEKALAVERDNFLYPPVEYADVARNQWGEATLVFKGRLPLMKQGCMKTQDARIDFQDGEMLVVQPISTITYLSGNEANEGCESQYEKKFNLPFAIDGKILVHVRSINGQSYNRVLDVATRHSQSH